MPATAPAPRRGPKPKLGTRDKLIAAGVRALHAGGYAASGIKEILDAAAVPKGSFYNHFASKEAFGSEVVDAYFAAGLPEIERRLRDPSLPPRERLEAYFADRAAAFREGGLVRGCLMGNLSGEIADHSETIRDRLARHFETWGTLLADCIAEAQASGAIASVTPAPLLARFVLDSWEGALLRMRADRSDRPLEDFRVVIFGSVLV